MGLPFAADPASGLSLAPALDHPPALGSSFNDFWVQLLNGDWELRQFPNANLQPDPVVNFGLQVNVASAIPEPGMGAAAALVAGLLAAGGWRRFGRWCARRPG